VPEPSDVNVPQPGRQRYRATGHALLPADPARKQTPHRAGRSTYSAIGRCYEMAAILAVILNTCTVVILNNNHIANTMGFMFRFINIMWIYF